MNERKLSLLLAVITVLLLGASQALPETSQLAPSRAHDPGVRGGDPGAGGPLPALTADEIRFFTAGRDDFEEVEGIADGLGPRLNLDSCGGCHAHPAVGGASPAVNPQVAMATAFGAKNAVPSFIKLDGPIREARFVLNADGSRDGGVHALYVISGRKDASGDATGCTIQQEDFERQVAANNIIFRIPTPMFGAGLIEAISDRTIMANQAANGALKAAAGIKGRPNRNGNDGTITRFGWKAQNKSLLLFSGEAYNVEMGITSELFMHERDDTPSCQFATTPNDVTATGASRDIDTVSAIERFSMFMRFLAAPSPSTAAAGGVGSLNKGRQLFTTVGCALCHTPTLTTGSATVAALSDQNVNLFSDLLVHAMGPGLADDVSQGGAAGDEFRTAPLWGLGQRLFLLHDGRATDLVDAIRAHKSAGNGKFGPSEANQVIDTFNALSEHDMQDLLNFLRSL